MSGRGRRLAAGIAAAALLVLGAVLAGALLHGGSDESVRIQLRGGPRLVTVSTGGGFSWEAALAVLAGGAVLAALVWAAARSVRAPAAAPAAPLPIPDDGLRRERDALARGCIAVRDQVPSAALRHDLGEALRAGGIVEVDASGERFDPARHRAVGLRATVDPRLDNLVAATDAVGYVDHGRTLREPDVIVYRLEATAP